MISTGIKNSPAYLLLKEAEALRKATVQDTFPTMTFNDCLYAVIESKKITILQEIKNQIEEK
jgi:hypothetical protein